MSYRYLPGTWARLCHIASRYLPVALRYKTSIFAYIPRDMYAEGNPARSERVVSACLGIRQTSDLEGGAGTPLQVWMARPVTWMMYLGVIQSDVDITSKPFCSHSCMFLQKRLAFNVHVCAAVGDRSERLSFSPSASPPPRTSSPPRGGRPGLDCSNGPACKPW